MGKEIDTSAAVSTKIFLYKKLSGFDYVTKLPYTKVNGGKT